MENVPEVVGTKNIKHFAEWLATLDGLGYKSKWQILNATDFNVPQNRERCFMVSVLGDYYYDFPTPSGCKLKLKDVLEKNVDESYYLKSGTIIKLNEHKERRERFYAQAIETLQENDCESGDTIDAYNKRVNKSGVCPTLTTRPEGFKTAILPIESSQIEVGKQIRVRKLTERECFRLMGVKDEDFEKIAKNQSKSSLYHLAGDSIVTAVLVAIFKQMI